MITILYAVAGVIAAGAAIYFAWRSRDVRKFLAGAFFVSSGILAYLYLAEIRVPLLGTSFVQEPNVAGARAIPHFLLFLLCFYFSFIHKPSSKA